MDDYSQPIPHHTPSPERAEALLQNPRQTLCFCHSIQARTAINYIRQTGTNSVEEVVRTCIAGSECGSCRDDIAELIRVITGREPDRRLHSSSGEHRKAD